MSRNSVIWNTHIRTHTHTHTELLFPDHDPSAHPLRLPNQTVLQGKCVCVCVCLSACGALAAVIAVVSYLWMASVRGMLSSSLTKCRFWLVVNPYNIIQLYVCVCVCACVCLCELLLMLEERSVLCGTMSTLCPHSPHHSQTYTSCGGASSHFVFWTSLFLESFLIYICYLYIINF